MSKITILQPIECYQPGEYIVVYLSQFIFNGEIHHVDADRLVAQYSDMVKPEYHPAVEFVWSEGPAI